MFDKPAGDGTTGARLLIAVGCGDANEFHPAVGTTPCGNKKDQYVHINVQFRTSY